MPSNSVPTSFGSALISVSIVSNGDGPELQRLLASLERHEPCDRLQLLVTDNLGSDLPAIPSAGWQSLVLLHPDRPRGFASNHNAAFESADGAFFCVLNPDVVFQQPVFAQLVRRLDQGAGDIAAPLMVDSAGVVQDSFRRLPSPWELLGRRLGRSGFIPPAPESTILRPDWIAGTFMLMRTATFSSLGGFDPRYRLYFEDVDLCARARIKGLVILVDTRLRLLHDPRRASRHDARYLVWHVQSALRFFTSGVYRRIRELKPRA